MHYRGLLRVVRREGGIRIYGLHAQEVHLKADTTSGARDRRVRLDGLVDVVVNVYAPLPAASLSQAVRRLRYAVPQWSNEMTGAWHLHAGRQAPVGRGGALTLDVGYAAGQAPRERRFSQALADERARLCAFLGLVD